MTQEERMPRDEEEPVTGYVADPYATLIHKLTVHLKHHQRTLLGAAHAISEHTAVIPGLDQSIANAIQEAADLQAGLTEIETWIQKAQIELSAIEVHRRQAIRHLNTIG